VALGTPYERLNAEYEAAASCRKAKADSTWGIGKTAPSPAGDSVLPGEPDVKVPMGKGAPNTKLKKGQASSLLYNEFIVYDTAQIKQRFVLQVRFKFR
jgi:hypothetical protein